MDGSKPYASPLVADTELSSSSTIGDPLFDPIEYRSILGTLQYLSLTELNIAFSMNQTCQFMHTNPPPVIKLRLNLFWGTSKAPLIMTYFSNLDSLKFKQAIQMIGGQRVTIVYISILIQFDWVPRSNPHLSRSSTESKHSSLATTVGFKSYYLIYMFFFRKHH